MPPKVKIQKQEIIEAAVALVRQSGPQAINARSIAAALDCSTQPIFSNFASMDALRLAVVAAADAQYQSYIKREIEKGEYPPYKASGMAYIRFAKDERELFKLLFLQEHNKGVSFEQALWDLDGMDETCVQLVMQDNGLTREQAKLLFEQMWTHALGLGTMCAMGVCDLPEEEIGRRQGIMFASLMTFIKSGKLDEVPVYAEKKDTICGHQVGDHPYQPGK